MGLFEDYLGDVDSAGRKSHFKNLVAMMLADGVIHENEKRLLGLLGAKCGLTQSEIDEVMSNPEGVEFVRPETMHERVSQLLEMVAMMLVDGSIHPDEDSLCKSVALKMGFRPAFVDKMVSDVVTAVRNNEAKDKIQVQVEEALTESGEV
jgi:uncharacterized tellurite resistance protein B-like protein